jgi:hypothetical protein
LRIDLFTLTSDNQTVRLRSQMSRSRRTIRRVATYVRQQVIRSSKSDESMPGAPKVIVASQGFLFDQAKTRGLADSPGRDRHAVGRRHPVAAALGGGKLQVSISAHRGRHFRLNVDAVSA